MEPSLNVIVKELRSALALQDASSVESEGTALRYELFHAANSICSQKVRAVLAHHGTDYMARNVNIMAGQSYLPSYVRMRMEGCLSLSVPLAATHAGSTSVTSGGCDAAVVPTLVDWKTNRVIVDSKLICLYLDEACPESLRLRPKALMADIDEELAIVDELPNYQMLMGKRPDGGETPITRKGDGGPGFSLSKVQRCERYLQEFANDAILVRAYSAKLNKELHAANQLFSPIAMKAAYAKADYACAQLNVKLRRGGPNWLFGDSVTMADLFWGAELLRMKNLGADTFWEGGRLQRVARFVSAAEALPSIRKSILEWPGALF